MREKKKAGKKYGRVICLISAVMLVTALTIAVVWMVTEGYMAVALNTVIRWGEDGTIDRLETVIVDRIIPPIVSVTAALGGLLAVLLPVIKKLGAAKDAMDKGTAEAVATYGERQKMQEEMRVFIAEQRDNMEALMEKQRVAFASMLEEQRNSLASDRAANRRIEGKVDGIRRMELEAFGATAELVRKGASKQIEAICKETEGVDTSEQEGGDGGDDGGDDGEAVEDTETDL